MEKIQRTIEVERVVNLVKGFGWELVETKTVGEVITIVISKTIVSLPAAAA